MWGEKAESVLEVEVAGHVTKWTWVSNILSVATGGSMDSPEYDLAVKMRSSGKVIHTLRLTGSIAAEQGLRDFEEDLKNLTLEAFCQKHSIPVPEHD